MCVLYHESVLPGIRKLFIGLLCNIYISLSAVKTIKRNTLLNKETNKCKFSVTHIMSLCTVVIFRTDIITVLIKSTAIQRNDDTVCNGCLQKFPGHCL